MGPEAVYLKRHNFLNFQGACPHADSLPWGVCMGGRLPGNFENYDVLDVLPLVASETKYEQANQFVEL